MIQFTRFLNFRFFYPYYPFLKQTQVHNVCLRLKSVLSKMILLTNQNLLFFKHLMLLGPILYWFFAFSSDGYTENVHNNGLCSSFPGQLSHIPMRKWCTRIVYKMFRRKIRPRRRGGYDCIKTLTSLWIKDKMLKEIKNKHAIFQ